MRTWSGARIRRAALRLGAAGSYAAAVAVAAALAAPIFESDASSAAPPPAVPTVAISVPERPESAPRRIPEWAWGMYAWHDDELGHVRPLDAPKRLPAWYWEWREWRAAVEAAKRAAPAPADA